VSVALSTNPPNKNKFNIKKTSASAGKKNATRERARERERKEEGGREGGRLGGCREEWRQGGMEKEVSVFYGIAGR
jgi:hypothetical protein